MTAPTFVLFGCHPMTDFEHVCSSDDPQKIIDGARGSYFSLFSISVKGERNSSQTFNDSRALKGYMDVRLEKDTPEARALKEVRRLMALGSRTY